jgi:hypothetical protein
MLLLTVGITYGEYYYMKSLGTEVPLTLVCCAKNTIEKGQKIEEDHLIYKSLKASDLDASYILSKDEVVNRYAIREIAQGSIVSKGLIEESINLSLTSSKDHILVTFEFDNASSNAWNLREGQVVELLFCADEGARKLYEDIHVSAVYDKNVCFSEKAGEIQLKYVTFEVEKEVGYELVGRRKDGRLEIIIL